MFNVAMPIIDLRLCIGPWHSLGFWTGLFAQLFDSMAGHLVHRVTHVKQSMQVTYLRLCGLPRL